MSLISCYNPPQRFVTMANNNQNFSTIPDELQVKLSLKKKIWSGLENPDSESLQRPFSWFKPNALSHPTTTCTGTSLSANSTQVIRKHQLLPSQLRQGGPNATTDERNHSRTVRGNINKKLENMELLTACSQKLLLWQQEENNRLTPAKSMSRFNKSAATHLGLQTLNTETMTVNGNCTRNVTPGVSNRKTQKKIATITNGSGLKVKRKSINSMMKIAETTHVIKRMDRVRNTGMASLVEESAGTITNGSNATNAQENRHGKSACNTQIIRQQKQQQHQLCNIVLHQQQTMGSAHGTFSYKVSSTTKQNRKFRTGGLVVTAVQQTNVSRNNTDKQQKLRLMGDGTVAPTDELIQRTRHFNLSATNPVASLTDIDYTSMTPTSTLARKVNPKLKKRKSRNFGATEHNYI